MCAESQCPCRQISSALSEDGLFSALMIQMYASSLVAVMNNLRSLEEMAVTWRVDNPPSEQLGNRVTTLLGAVAANCGWLKLRSAWKQLETIRRRVKDGCENNEFAQLIAELRRRISEDLDDRVFYCITDTSKIDRFFKHKDDGLLVAKQVNEAFDERILGRFGDCIDDLVEASKCYVTACYTACAFHLMRVVEYGLMEVSVLAGITDPRPSWGAVLSKVDLYAFRTKHTDLPDALKPHHELLREISSEMHAIQYAWRNRVSHIENKLVPVKPIDHPMASEIMTTVEVFMRSLAERLPPKSV